MYPIRLALACILATGSLSASADVDPMIPSGHVVINDGRTWSCKALTQEEKDEIATYRLEQLMGTSANSEHSCIIRDESGKPKFFRRREVLPGSSLITYDEQSKTYRKVTWSARVDGLSTIYDAKGVALIELPRILVSVGEETWQVSSEEHPRTK